MMVRMRAVVVNSLAADRKGIGRWLGANGKDVDEFLSGDREVLLAFSPFVF